MPVSVATGVTGPFIPNGVATSFAFLFKADSASEVIVVDENGDALSAALYSVDLDDDEGGTVTFSVAPLLADYAELYIVSNPAMTQASDFGNTGPSFNPRSLTRAIDRAAIRDLALKAQLDRTIKVPFGDSGTSLPADRAGQFLSFDANGVPIVSSGTGADAGLRTDLIASSGSALSGFAAAGSGPVSRTVRDKLREIVTPGDYTTGANGALTAVRNLSDAAFSGSVHVPNVLIDITAAITAPQSFARISGEAWGGCIRALTAIDIFDLSGASHTNSRFADFRISGGVNVFDASTAGEIASNFYDRLSLSSFSGDAWYFTGGVTSCYFGHCYVDSSTGDRGIYSGGGINNDNTVFCATFANLTDAAIKTAGTVSGLYVSNFRVEGNGQSGKAVFDLTAAIGVSFRDGWLEGYHETLLKISGASPGPIVLDGLVDIGAKNGVAFKAGLFDVGSTLITFGSNRFNNRTVAPLNSLVIGQNDNLDLAASNTWQWKTGRGGKVHLKARNVAVDTAVFDILTFTRAAATPADKTNLQTCAGVLTLIFSGENSVGTASRRVERWPVSVIGVGAAFDMEIGTAFGATTASANGVTVVPTEKAGGTTTSKTLKLTVAGHLAAAQCLIDATFEFSNNTNLATNPITVSPA